MWFFLSLKHTAQRTLAVSPATAAIAKASRVIHRNLTTLPLLISFSPEIPLS
jgi:hypothetical protein